MTALQQATGTALSRIIADKQATGRVPGMVAGVARAGRLAWSDAIGCADVDRPDVPPTVDQQFLIASNTKTFTAVMVMALRDEGRLDLDTTLDEIVPECGHAGLTVRQMLAHASGMQREPVTDVWESLDHPDREQLIDGFAEAEQVLAPNQRFHYSNLVYAMLGEVVARLDGREWFDSVRARILDPLEMTDTTLGLQRAAVQGYYVPPFSDVPVVEPTFDQRAMSPCGGLASTARDLARWSAFVADPVAEVLRPDTLEEMTQPQIMVDVRRWTLALGLGFMLLRSGERLYVGHTGGMPGHITGLFTHRESGTGAMVLMNATNAPDPAALAVALADHVLEYEPEPVQPWRAGTEVPDELAGVLGRWYCEGEPVDFVVREGQLHATSTLWPAYQRPAVFVRVEPNLYRTRAGRETGELLRMTRREDGSVATMHWATYPVTREPLAFGQQR